MLRKRSFRWQKAWAQRTALGPTQLFWKWVELQQELLALLQHKKSTIKEQKTKEHTFVLSGDFEPSGVSEASVFELRQMSLVDPNALSAHMALAALTGDFWRHHVFSTTPIGVSDCHPILFVCIGQLR